MHLFCFVCVCVQFCNDWEMGLKWLSVLCVPCLPTLMTELHENKRRYRERIGSGSGSGLPTALPWRSPCSAASVSPLDIYQSFLNISLPVVAVIAFSCRCFQALQPQFNKTEFQMSPLAEGDEKCAA